jgi:hypothetical protein
LRSAIIAQSGRRPQKKNWPIIRRRIQSVDRRKQKKMENSSDCGRADNQVN